MGNLSHLPRDEERRVIWVSSWITRMARRYGGIVRDDKASKIWDWGQALCRECYGIEWIRILQEEDIESPSEQDVTRAKAWEGGEWPDWVDMEYIKESTNDLSN